MVYLITRRLLRWKALCCLILQIIFFCSNQMSVHLEQVFADTKRALLSRKMSVLWDVHIVFFSVWRVFVTIGVSAAKRTFNSCNYCLLSLGASHLKCQPKYLLHLFVQELLTTIKGPPEQQFIFFCWAGTHILLFEPPFPFVPLPSLFL